MNPSLTLFFIPGMYPYHIGRQKGTIKPLQPTGLTLNRTLLSEKLKLLGYKTHIFNVVKKT